MLKSGRRVGRTYSSAIIRLPFHVANTDFFNSRSVLTLCNIINTLNSELPVGKTTHSQFTRLNI